MFKAIQDFLSLFFPRTCVGCQESEALQGDVLCLDCLVNLPYLQENYQQGNTFEMHFAGHLPIRHGMALFYYQKQSITQRLIQNFKYQGRLDIARRFAPELAQLIKNSPIFTPIEAVVPVPMHWLKQRQRGYNQSAVLAQALAHELGVPVINMLGKVAFSRSQTTKDRLGRLSSLRGKYRLTKVDVEWENKHVLLVDDVLTTGATLETCGQLLLSIPGCQLSLATLAMGR